MKNATQEISYSRSGFVRVVQSGAFFEVQARSIRAERKLGSLTFWAKLYGVTDREKAIRLLETYAA